MTVAEALSTIERQDQTLFALLQSIYAESYTGMVILYCFEGVPKRAEFPGQQVRLTSTPAPKLDKQPALP